MSPTFGKRRTAQRHPIANRTVDVPTNKASHGYGKIIAVSTLALFIALLLVGLLGGRSQVSSSSSSSSAASASPTRSSLPDLAQPKRQTRPRSATPTYPVVTPETICKERYRLDHDMRDTCVRVQETAELEASSIQIDDDVKVLCARRYIHDWSMYVTCAKLEMARKLSASEKPDRPRFDIVRKCEEEWPTKRDMQEYCTRKQEAASARASGGWIPHQVAVICTSQHPHDWHMFMYCVDNRTNHRKVAR